MAISNVANVTVFVKDQDAALDFYKNRLGFDVRRDDSFGGGMRWLEVAPPGGQTSIVLARGYGEWDEGQIGKFSRIVFMTEDCQATYEELAARGVEFTEKPTAQPWGMVQAQFVDQDGNGYVLVGAK
jgi:catechol 2,3-dioxygenase-like lactoylglutathione lyase family enzyme